MLPNIVLPLYHRDSSIQVMDMFCTRSLYVVLVLTVLMNRSQSTSVEDVAQMAVQNLQDNMADDTLLLRDIFKLNHNNHQDVKSRPKRIIELPTGMVYELKWNIDVPFQSFVRFDTLWQFAALIDAMYPSEILQDTEEPTLAEIVPPYIGDIIQDTFTDGRDEDVLNRKDGAASDRRRDQVVLQRKKRAARTEREAVYSLLERTLEASGLPPRACLLRTICEVAEAPFEQELLGDLINTIFRPSKGADSTSGDDYDELLMAEHHGHHNGSCHLQYGQCPETVFDRIPFFRHELFY